MIVIIKKALNRVKIFVQGGGDCIKDFVQNTIAESSLCSFALRRWILMIYGHKVHILYSRCVLGEGPGHLYIGKRSFCNRGCFFDLGDDIIIGDRCCVAMNVSFINGSHRFGPHEKRGGKGFTLPIKVGNGVWIGANVTILPGVTIGDGCFIAAGSLVTKDCEPDGFYVGSPARRIRDFED